MVVDMAWITQTVDVPVWGLLVLAGYQRVTQWIGGAREQRRERRERGQRNAARGGRR